MKVDEVLSKAEVFTNNLISKISDKNEQLARKQAFFLDSQEELQKYMGALQKIVASYSEDNEEDSVALLTKAETIIDNVKNAIATFQQELMVSSDVTQEDTTAQFTEETLSDAMKNNKTTQEISANMQAIAEQQKAAANVPAYNYALVCDGNINLISATSKEELNNAINSIANAGTYKDIQLFQMQFVPVPVKKKTVLTV